jgi:hypothetical protein
MKTVATLIAAALVTAGATTALAQGAGGSGAGASGAGGDPSTPRQNMTRPTPNSPPANRRSDEMAPPQGSAVTGQVVLAPEQRTAIKQYVTSHKVAPVKLRERVSVGATLPASVRLAPVPAEWGPSYSNYSYVYSNNHVFFVEPSTRRVVTVVD